MTGGVPHNSPVRYATSFVCALILIGVFVMLGAPSAASAAKSCLNLLGLEVLCVDREQDQPASPAPTSTPVPAATPTPRVTLTPDVANTTAPSLLSPQNVPTPRGTLIVPSETARPSVTPSPASPTPTVRPPNYSDQTEALSTSETPPWFLPAMLIAVFICILAAGLALMATRRE